MNNRLSVLIVGAGPTGLMMACQLARLGISFRIIDKKPIKQEGSKATWVQACTLEILDAMGIADRFLRIGHRCDAISLYANGKPATNISLNDIGSIYSFALMISQFETERLLNECLEAFNSKVERPCELTNIQQTNNEVVSTIRLANGATETITSDWVVACDGANSTVRYQCQIEFPGKDFPEQFMVADAQMSSHLPKNEIHVFFDKGTIFPEKGTLFSAFPWGSNKYRLSANLYHEKPRLSFTEQEVREVVAERTYGNFIVDSISWIYPFWIHSKVINNLRHGAIFFAGDAAHIHSPAGGQGMNTGMQDAYNLAWKLAYVIKNKARSELLDSYHAERYPVVKNIVNQTEYFTNLMLFDRSFFSKLKKFSKKVSRNPKLSQKIGMHLAQLDIRYEESQVIDYPEKIHAKSPRQGEHLPDVIFGESKKLYDSFQNELHNILIFAGLSSSKNSQRKIKKLQKLIKKNFSTLLKVTVVSKEELADIDNIILDKDEVIHRRYNLKSPFIYVVRPDNYIAYCSRKIDFGLIEKFLRVYLQ